MKVKLEEKKCSWCKIEFQGRSYQEFCSTSCSDKSYYWHNKRGLSRKIPQIKCDVCGNFFQPKRNNTKRCSNVCRSKWVRNFSHERYKVIQKKLIDKAPTRICAVCETPFKLTSIRQKNCSKKCSTVYGSYSAKKRRKKRVFVDGCGRSIEEVIIPMPDHDSIPVGKVDVNSSEDLKDAVKAFVKGGGKIRTYKASVATDLIDNHPLGFDDVNTEEVRDQISGTIRVK